LKETTQFKVEINFDTEINLNEKFGTHKTFVMKKPGEKTTVPVYFAIET